MANTFFIDVDDTHLKKLLANLKAKSGNMRPAMLTIGNVLANSIRRNFDEGGRPEKWAPLSAATIQGSLSSKDYDKRRKTKTLNARATKRQAARRILVGLGMRGGLMGSIHAEAEDESVSAGPDNKPYARIQQFGGEAGRKGSRVTIPARRYLVAQDGDIEIAKEIILDFMTGNLP